MSRKDQQYDQSLLRYYYGKDIDVLNRTETKYKRYADRLAGKCEALKKKIDLLYKDFTQANVLYQNSKKLENRITRDEKEFHVGKKERTIRPPWCPPDDEEDDDDFVEEVRRDEVIAKLHTEKKVLEDFKKLYDPVIKTILGGTISTSTSP